MKTQNKIKFSLPVIFLLFAAVASTKAQNVVNPIGPAMAFIDVDTRGSNAISPNQQVAAITRIELEKLKRFQLLDKYDLEFLVGRDSLKIRNCYSRICLAEMGKKLKVEKVFTGSVDELSEQIIITFKILDVQSGQFEKVQVNEFLNIPKEIKNMIQITINDMFAIANNTDIVNKLTRKDDYDNSINNPYQLRLRSDGPRMGFTYFTGDAASIIRASRSDGGFEASPLMFQFGYQIERQYLNEGNFQALFEFVPMLTGLDQGLFIPSITFMNGMRSNKSGWEFAFGPSLALVTKARGFYDQNKNWHLGSDNSGYPNSAVETRLDSRGNADWQAGFVFAFGRTFKSGKLNMPVNGYVIPSKDGMRLGFSFGFNAKERYTLSPAAKKI